MSATPEQEFDLQSPHPYFVDETSDGVVFDSKGQVLLGTGKLLDAQKIKNQKVED